MQNYNHYTVLLLSGNSLTFYAELGFFFCPSYNSFSLYLSCILQHTLIVIFMNEFYNETMN